MYLEIASIRGVTGRNVNASKMNISRTVNEIYFIKCILCSLCGVHYCQPRRFSVAEIANISYVTYETQGICMSNTNLLEDLKEKVISLVWCFIFSKAIYECECNHIH